ncbi:MAG: acyltransferase [Deltaproteobacteria bacterium]|nr:acyltransferase [Deltaproteobacteria bacterium]
MAHGLTGKESTSQKLDVDPAAPDATRHGSDATSVSPARQFNNFDLLRHTLAVVVLLCHVNWLTKLESFRSFGFLSSDFAVKGFFTISGYLVAQSYVAAGSVRRYAEKRIRRIYPAYFGVVIFCFVAGALTSTLPPSEFLSNPAAWKYLAANLAFLNFLQPTLPGVFALNPVQMINGSLWTIKVEVGLYCSVPFVVAAFRRLGPLKCTAGLYAASVGWVLVFRSLESTYPRLAPALAHQLPAQLSYFVLGILVAEAALPKRVLAPIAICSSVALAGLSGSLFSPVIEPICFASTVLWIALIPKLPKWKLPDVSYGLYLFHFPTIQLLLALGVFEFSPWVGFVLAIGCASLLALASWTFVERPTLRRDSLYVTSSHTSPSSS